MSPLAQRGLGVRWMKFSVVGLLGIGVQLAMLAVLTRSGLHYLLATAIAVETAVLHNYAWHRRWTWGERGVTPAADARRLLRFHVANGLVSLVSNLLWMRVLTGVWGMPAVPANVLAIGATSLVNFALSERWVFKPAIAEPGR
jgi:putative flippase GtrA